MTDDTVAADALPTEAVTFRGPKAHAEAKVRGPQRAVMLDPRQGASAPFEMWQGMTSDR